MAVTVWSACLLNAMNRKLDTLLVKSGHCRCWGMFGSPQLNEQQVKVIDGLLDGFEDKLCSDKWAATAKCSADTARRDITDLLWRGAEREI